MPESKAHRDTANRIAKKLNTQYNNGKGVDIVTGGKAIEVETPGTVKGALTQLQGQRKPSYIAGTNKEAVEIALQVTQGTTIGVMDNRGNIVRSSSRKKS